jgi:hypothetical protein
MSGPRRGGSDAVAGASNLEVAFARLTRIQLRLFPSGSPDRDPRRDRTESSPVGSRREMIEHVERDRDRLVGSEQGALASRRLDALVIEERANRIEDASVHLGEPTIGVHPVLLEEGVSAAQDPRRALRFLRDRESMGEPAEDDRAPVAVGVVGTARMYPVSLHEQRNGFVDPSLPERVGGEHPQRLRFHVLLASKRPRSAKVAFVQLAGALAITEAFVRPGNAAHALQHVVLVTELGEEPSGFLEPVPGARPLVLDRVDESEQEDGVRSAPAVTERC